MKIQDVFCFNWEQKYNTCLWFWCEIGLGKLHMSIFFLYSFVFLHIPHTVNTRKHIRSVCCYGCNTSWVWVQWANGLKQGVLRAGRCQRSCRWVTQSRTDWENNRHETWAAFCRGYLFLTLTTNTATYPSLCSYSMLPSKLPASQMSATSSPQQLLFIAFLDVELPCNRVQFREQPCMCCFQPTAHALADIHLMRLLHSWPCASELRTVICPEYFLFLHPTWSYLWFSLSGPVQVKSWSNLLHVVSGKETLSPSNPSCPPSGWIFMGKQQRETALSSVSPLHYHTDMKTTQKQHLALPARTYLHGAGRWHRWRQSWSRRCPGRHTDTAPGSGAPEGGAGV